MPEIDNDVLFNDESDNLEEDGAVLPSFEKKYKDLMRQIVTQRLDIPISTLPIMLKDQIKIDPEFQRRDRWDETRQSRLIESLLMNVPIPPVFLGEDTYGAYVVLDGRQRLTAIRNFLNNTLKLRKLSVWDDLNGMRYEDLVKRGLDKHLTRRFVPAVVILKESSPVVKYDVFERLNTGGIKANNMEIRNAVFRGEFTNNLHKLARNPVFCSLWGIPTDRTLAESNVTFQLMDDLLLVLRFFALSEPQDFEGPFRDYLSDFMQKRNSVYDDEAKALDTARFNVAVRNTWKVFGEEAFRNPGKPAAGRSMPLADAVMVGLGDIPPDQITDAIAREMKKGFSELCMDAEFAKAISAGTNGKGAIVTRIEKAKAFFDSYVL